MSAARGHSWPRPLAEPRARLGRRRALSAHPSARAYGGRGTFAAGAEGAEGAEGARHTAHGTRRVVEVRSLAEPCSAEPSQRLRAAEVHPF